MIIVFNLARFRGLASFAAMLAAIFLSACASTPSERFYTLDASPTIAVAPSDANANTGANTRTNAVATSTSNALVLNLMINRITLPEAVDRPQFVLQMSQNQVRLDEQHRWAESLRQAIPRIIASDLRQHLQTARIAVAGDSSSPTAPNLLLAMDVLRFESQLGEGVRLEVHWQLRNATGSARNVVADSVTDLRENSIGASHDALVSAHRKTLATFAKTIADRIAALPRQP